MFFKNNSFNAGKCKTKLRLAISRIKLLRNMRHIQLKKMKGELANLLKANQEPSAHLKVEHVYREQNIVAAYEIIELLCQQIVEHLPVIEAQKQCPINLREAVATIIYAAPRCSDVPELQRIRCYFSSKYGKAFMAIAGELRADCGVNRVVTEKLSVNRPSVEVKLKLMKEVAVEYRLNWDPSVLESQILTRHEDFLEGPSQFVGASQTCLGSSSGEPAYSSSFQHNAVSVQLEARISTQNSVISDERQSIHFVRPAVKVENPSKSQLPSRVLTPRSQNSFGHASHVSSVSSHDYKEDENVQPVSEKIKSFQKVVSAATKAAESAERAAAAARAAIAIASQKLDETGSNTDNESDNDGNETLQSIHNEQKSNPPFIDAEEERGLYRKQDSLECHMQQGGHLGHSASPSVVSVEGYADNDDDDVETDDDRYDSLSRFMPDRHAKSQVSSHSLDNRFFTSRSSDYQLDSIISQKKDCEMSRAAPIFDTEDWGDLTDERTAKVAVPVLAEPPSRAPPKVPAGQTRSLTKNTSFTHPKLPDCDEFVAHFRALKALNTKKSPLL
ncbi:hypothetical protein L7F22_029934 [Adiantum nelumboides]|nr:hypothetical protein [Adiantum nelumboides]